VDAQTYIVALVENKPSPSIIDIIGCRLDSLTVSLLRGTKMAREAMTDLLKFTFNLLAHYPKVCVLMFNVYF